ncbi:hypothetical protein MRB53_040772 [Persea americana]|nr:hypothetical protein MRB53_040772 [Persea americana]
MDGLTTIRHIRKWQAAGVIARHVPVIALEALVAEGHRRGGRCCWRGSELHRAHRRDMTRQRDGSGRFTVSPLRLAPSARLNNVNDYD